MSLENFNGGDAEQSPELSTDPSSSDPSAQPEGATGSNVFDLDSAEKVKWEGQEYTRDELKKMRMRHEDYTRKTQALAEERKQYQGFQRFVDNLDTDLEAVKKNPSLAAQFRSVYPSAFHGRLDQVLKSSSNQTGAQQQQAVQNGLDPATLERIQAIETHFHQMEMSAINKELDAKFTEYSKKYNFADEEAVISRAQYLLDLKDKDGDKTPITDKQWDSIWKSVHDGNLTRFKQYQGSLANGQLKANAKSKDMGSGGGIPGQAPKTPKNIREASEMLRAMDKEAAS